MGSAEMIAHQSINQIKIPILSHPIDKVFVGTSVWYHWYLPYCTSPFWQIN
jgi:hypothetical protein